MNFRTRRACRQSIQKLIGSGWAYLWTLTTADAVDPAELSRRWRKLIWNGFPACVRVFERHPGGHGYHVHFVAAQRLEVGELRPRAESVGFGRINVRRIPGAAATYIAKYLTKQRGCPGVRMWAAVGFKGVSVRNAVCTSPYAIEVKMVMARYLAPSGYNFWARWKVAEERHAWLWEDARKHWNDPNYKPPFKALFEWWKLSPEMKSAKIVAASRVESQCTLNLT